MGSLNDGVFSVAGGRLLVVIHEMWCSGTERQCHLLAFSWLNRRPPAAQQRVDLTAPRARLTAGSELHSALRERGDGSVTTELIVVGGSDLTERKALLKERAEAFIALPGGSGTWDELWEVVCEKSLGIGVASEGRAVPIVLVNTDGYYDGFLLQMKRAYADGILYVDPSELVASFDSPTAALEYCEGICGPTPSSSLSAPGGAKAESDENRSPPPLRGSGQPTLPAVQLPSLLLGLVAGAAAACLLLRIRSRGALAAM